MLFHVTSTHTADNCPAYNGDLREALGKAQEQMPRLAQELGVTVHFIVTGAPDHVVFSLLEADDLAAVARLLGAVPFKQDFRITPVQRMGEAVAALSQSGG
jgi:hypothetical protein